MVPRALQALAVVASLCLLLVLVLAIFGLPVLDSLSLIANGALSDKFALARTAVKATPLLLTALGIAVAWRAGMFNIGAEGQFILGGLTAAAVAKPLLQTSAPAPLITLALLLACIVGGSFWAWLAGWLYAKRGVDIVISTILLNFVAIQLLGYSVSGPLQELRGQLPLTDLLPREVMLLRPDRQTDLHIGVLLALASAAAIHIVFFRTPFGFQLRLVGANPRAARASRVPVHAVQVRAMVLSGALAGLAGGVEYLGMAGQLGSTFAASWGFLGIPVALIAGLNPILIPVSALFFGGVLAGSENLARFSAAGTTLLYVVQGAAVLGFVALKALGERRRVVVEAT